MASINYIVLDLDPTSSSESSAVAPTRDSVPNSAGIYIRMTLNTIKMK